MNWDPTKFALLRITEADRKALEKVVFKRHPHREWASFFQFGFRETTWGLAISFVKILPPEPGDIDRQSDIVWIQSKYTARVLEDFRISPLAMGIVHSHPKDCSVAPSPTDDHELDTYFPDFFEQFAENRPFASLIFGRDSQDRFIFSGRVKYRGRWIAVQSLHTVGTALLQREESALRKKKSLPHEKGTTPRLDDLLGDSGAKRLRSARIGVVGTSGTGSPAVHLLLREGIGELVLIDFDHFEPSNLERLHGSEWKHLQSKPLKVELMRAMARAINPSCHVTAIVGNILDEKVIDELLRCDLIFGCMDTFHGRVVLGDLASHYLLPSIDMGVSVDGEGGKVKAQILEMVFNAPQLPCPHCDQRINTQQLAVELMSEEEKNQRRAEAHEAEQRGMDGRAYWRGELPPILTVGYLTTNIASQAVGFAVGWLTGAFSPPHSRYQMNLNSPLLGVVDVPRERRPTCSCGKCLGWSDQAMADRSISRPRHWLPSEWLPEAIAEPTVDVSQRGTWWQVKSALRKCWGLIRFSKVHECPSKSVKDGRDCP